MKVGMAGISRVLAFAGGGVDAVILMGFQVLTAAQTGNTILFAAALARGDLATGLSAGLSILAFVVGAGLGVWISSRGREPLSWPLFMEAALLLIVMSVWMSVGIGTESWAGGVIVVGSALAMGAQSGTMLAAHQSPTTYVTGILTGFSHDLVSRAGGERKSPFATWAHGITWALYLLGAITAGLLFVRIGALALALPGGLLLLAAVASRSLPKVERG